MRKPRVTWRSDLLPILKRWVVRGTIQADELTGVSRHAGSRC